MAEVKIKIAAGTNVGLVRKNNEDNFIVNKDLTQDEWFVPQSSESITMQELGCILAVADGMGGTNAGEVASAIAIETIQKEFASDVLKKVLAESDPDVLAKKVEKFLVSVIKSADLNIINASKNDSSTQGMGTTIVLAWIVNNKAYISWCGDSRCYVFNPNAGICRLSKDHSYVQDLVDQGKLDYENAFSHPCSNIITRCLGDPSVRAVPDFRCYELKEGDTLLLCTDGLCGLCQDEEIIQIMDENQSDIGNCKDRLIEAALSAGGYDNVTVAICHCIDGNETIKDDLNATQYTLPKKSNFLRFLLVLLFLAAVFFVCYYFNAFNLKSDIVPSNVDSVMVQKQDTMQ